MKPAVLTLVLSALAAPAMAGGVILDFPTLTWPEPQPTVSTSNCQPQQAACSQTR